MKNKLFIALLTLCISMSSHAQQKSIAANDSIWQKIGETSVDYRNVSNEIKVNKEDKFNFIKFSVTEAPINLTGLEIYFVTGVKQEVMVDMKITSDTEQNQNIELYAGERKLSKVRVTIDSLPDKFPANAVLQLWGLKKED